MKVVILCIVLFCLEDSSARLSHFGNEFYLACTPNLESTSTGSIDDQRCIFSISTVEPKPVRVSISHKCDNMSNVVCRTSVSVTQDQVTTYTLSRLLSLSLNGVDRRQQYNHGVHFKAENNKNISIVFLNDRYGTADAYLGIPVHPSSSREIQYVYYAISAPQPQSVASEQKGFIAIVTTMDNTAVTVTPGDTYLPTYTFFSKEVNCSSATHCFLPRRGTTIIIAHSEDLTGRKVVADKPITLLSGHQCANMPAKVGNCDHMVEQIPPISNWGRNFMLAPLHSRKAYVYRVVASQNDTSVKVVCGNQGGDSQTNDTRMLQAGSFHEATVNTTEGYCFVSANHPVMTVQYCLGYKYEGESDRKLNTDPFLVQIPAIEQYSNINRLAFLNISNIIRYHYSTLYVTITIPSAYYQPNDILINGGSLQARIQKGHRGVSIGNVKDAGGDIQGYTVAIVVPSGTKLYDIRHRNPSAVLGTIVYAYGSEKSYGYVGSLGLNEDIISPPTTIKPTTSSSPAPPPVPKYCDKHPENIVTCWEGMDSLLYIPEGQTANLVIGRSGRADCFAKDCFRITTSAGNATKGVDYQMNEVCCYEGNSREANCPIHILKDNLDEEEESFEVVLSSSHESQLVCTGQKATIRVKIGNISPTPDDSMSLSAEISVAISVVVVLVIILPIGIALLVFFVCKRKRKHRQGNMMTPEHSAKASINPPSLILPSNTVRYTDLSWLPSADNWEVDWSNFELEDKIGSGNYGSVYKGRLDMAFDCQRIRNYKQEMITKGKSTYAIAVKISKGGLEREEIEAFLSEIAMMKRVSEGNNPHVVKMVGCVATMLPLALLLEYVPHGNLREFLKNCKSMDQTKGVNINGGFEEDSDDGYINKNSLPMGEITEDTVAGVLLGSKDFLSFGYQIASGMEYLTSLDVIHRDLACRNVLVDANMVLKISDFGLARNSKLYMSAMKDKLPLRWMAPETFTTNTFNEQSDVWSYGVCLWEIYTYGDVPYKELPITVILPRVVSGYRLKKPENCPNEVYTIMEKCWCYSSDKRPNFKSTRTMFEGMISQDSGAQYTTIIT